MRLTSFTAALAAAPLMGCMFPLTCRASRANCFSRAVCCHLERSACTVHSVAILQLQALHQLGCWFHTPAAKLLLCVDSMA